MTLRGKVLLVPFPFDDFSAQKVRPLVCLTEPIGPHRHVVVAFITSRVAADFLATDLLLSQEHPDFRRTGLHVTSTLRVHRLMTVPTNFIERELGELSPTLLAEIQQRLLQLFSLNDSVVSPG